jgi:YidC/Oxa1 family membrane protein insertase
LSAIWEGFVTAMEWALRLCFDFTGNAGLAIMVFTVAIKLILMPVTIRQLKSSREMQALQPKLRELQKKYAKDREKLNQATMELYREHGVNPTAGCLPSLLQMPIFFGVYYAVLNLSRVPSLGALVSRWMGFSTTAFLGLGAIPADIWTNLSKGILANEPFLWMATMGQPDPLKILPILAGVLQLIQQRMMTPRGGNKDPQQSAMNNSMMFMPLMIVFIGWSFPAGPVLYWVSQSLFGIVQQYFTSGWGALADWLPFLPERKRPEKVPQPKPKAAATVVDGESQEGSRKGFFWRLMDQMSALQEQAAGQVDAEGAGETTPEEVADETSLPPAPTKRRSSR